MQTSGLILGLVAPAAQGVAGELPSGREALVGALLAVSGLALAPVVARLVRRIHPGRQVFFARWGFTHVVEVAAGLVVGSLVVGALWPAGEETGLDGLLARSVLGFAIAGAVAALVARRVSPEGAAALGLRAGRNASAVAAGLCAYALLAPALLGLSLAWPWLVEALGGEYVPQDVVRRFAEGLPAGRLALAVVLAVVVQPFLEELLFRGFLQPLLVQNFRDAGGVVLTSLAFAALHGLGAFLPIFALSLLLGGLKLRTQRLSAAWAVHAVHNGLTLALLLFAAPTPGASPPAPALLAFFP